MKRNFQNKEIVLGVTGSIAAYKACELASRLAELGARVQPALTRAAAEFVGPASFEAICGRRAITALFEPMGAAEIEHISVAQRAGLYLIAPATADILAKAAHGLADDWLSTTLLATRAPVLFAPAMNTNMYTHPATQANIETLKARGCHFVGPAEGRLACRTLGPGRMAEPETVLEAAAPLLRIEKDFAGKRVVITSGGVREPIDPVRYIGNRSSGKMGRALALEALARGAAVTFITAPSEVPPPHDAEVVNVESTSEMAAAVDTWRERADIIIGAAAVADYRPAHPTSAKIKRTGAPIELRLEENPDIIAAAGARKRAGQIVVAFAAETDNVLQNARRKLEEKHADLIVVNEAAGENAAFGRDTVRAAILGYDGANPELELIAKDDVAFLLFNRIAALLTP